MRANAAALVPVDLGPLVNSIMWRKGWDTDLFGFPKEGGFNEGGGREPATVQVTALVKGLEGVVGSGMEYALYQEFGTRYMPAQPFLRPGAAAVRGASAAEIARQWGNAAMYRAFQQRKTERRVN